MEANKREWLLLSSNETWTIFTNDLMQFLEVILKEPLPLYQHPNARNVNKKTKQNKTNSFGLVVLEVQSGSIKDWVKLLSLRNRELANSIKKVF